MTSKEDHRNQLSQSTSNDTPYHQFGYYPEDDLIITGDDEIVISSSGGNSNTITISKQNATNRFNRNNILISEVFSDKIVPDVRTVVTNNRLEVLRKQADSLILHQERSLNELANMEQTFLEKKRRLLESSEEFNKKLDRYCKPIEINDDVYQKMLNQAMDQIRQHYDNNNQKSQKPLPATKQSTSSFKDDVHKDSKSKEITKNNSQPSPLQESKTKRINVQNETSQSSDSNLELNSNQSGNQNLSKTASTDATSNNNAMNIPTNSNGTNSSKTKLSGHHHHHQQRRRSSEFSNVPNSIASSSSFSSQPIPNAIQNHNPCQTSLFVQPPTEINQHNPQMNHVAQSKQNKSQYPNGITNSNPIDKQGNPNQSFNPPHHHHHTIHHSNQLVQHPQIKHHNNNSFVPHSQSVQHHPSPQQPQHSQPHQQQQHLNPHQPPQPLSNHQS